MAIGHLGILVSHLNACTTVWFRSIQLLTYLAVFPGTEDSFSSSIPDGVDIVMTHGPPRGILDLIPSKGEHAGCEALLRAMQRVRPLMHCFGHIHEGYGVEMKHWGGEGDGAAQTVVVSRVGTEQACREEHTLTKRSDTLMVNAAVMDAHNIPTHAQWVVELELSDG